MLKRKRRETSRKNLRASKNLCGLSSTPNVVSAVVFTGLPHFIFIEQLSCTHFFWTRLTHPFTFWDCRRDCAHSGRSRDYGNYLPSYRVWKTCASDDCCFNLLPGHLLFSPSDHCS